MRCATRFAQPATRNPQLTKPTQLTQPTKRTDNITLLYNHYRRYLWDTIL